MPYWKILSSCCLVRYFVFAGLLFTYTNAFAAPVFGYTVVSRFPHSTQNYTEGFFYLNGLFYEGTGLEGRSALLVSQPGAAQPVQSLTLAPQYFGEGIVDWGPNVYEWT